MASMSTDDSDGVSLTLLKANLAAGSLPAREGLRPAARAFRVQNIVDQVFSYLPCRERILLVAVNQQTFHSATRTVWREAGWRVWHLVEEMASIGSRTHRRAHYAVNIHTLALNGGMPGLTTMTDACDLFDVFPNLRKITWSRGSMTRTRKDTYDIDTGIRNISTVKLPAKPPVLPRWIWGTKSITATYPVTVHIWTHSRWSTELSISRVRSMIEPFCREPVSTMRISKHSWSGHELAVLADILAERHKEIDIPPVQFVDISLHLTNCASLLAPLERITAFGTKIRVDLLTCKTKDNPRCQGGQDGLAYSQLVPYIERTTAAFVFGVINDGVGGYRDTSSTNMDALYYPTEQVDEISYSCLMSRSFLQCSEDEQAAHLRNAFRPMVQLWRNMAAPGCTVLREGLHFVETIKGQQLDDSVKRTLGIMDEVMKMEVASVSLQWRISSESIHGTS